MRARADEMVTDGWVRGDVVWIGVPQLRRVGARWHWRVLWGCARETAGGEWWVQEMSEAGSSIWRWLAVVRAGRAAMRLHRRYGAQEDARTTEWEDA